MWTFPQGVVCKKENKRERGRKQISITQEIITNNKQVTLQKDTKKTSPTSQSTLGLNMSVNTRLFTVLTINMWAPTCRGVNKCSATSHLTPSKGDEQERMMWRPPPPIHPCNQTLALQQLVNVCLHDSSYANASNFKHFFLCVGRHTHLANF